MPRFTIGADGKTITCHTCGLTSHHPEDVAHRYCGMCKRFHTDARAVYLFTIYDSPADFPGQFIVRRWRIGTGGGTVPDSGPACAATLAAARALLPPGLTRLGRAPEDEPQVVETWI